MRLPVLGAQPLLAPEGGAASAHAADPHGHSYDNPRFWDRAHLDGEIERVFTICNGCRLCFNLCPSFDVLFKRIDALDPEASEAEGKHLSSDHAQGMVEETDAAKLLDSVKVGTANPVQLLQPPDIEKVVGLCYECKLCYPKCPYVPPHEFAVDFPRLIQRRKILDAKEHGIGLRERMLGSTDLMGSLMSPIAPLANFAAHNTFNRFLMDLAIGIAKDRQLPDYAGQTFEAWWRTSGRKQLPPAAPPPTHAPATAHALAPAAAHAPAPAAAPSDAAAAPAPALAPLRVALFPTCFGNYNDPEIPKAAVDLLLRAGCDLVCPEVSCCGMPKMDCGDLDGARALAKKNLAVLLPLVRDGRKVLSPGPSCTLMLKQEYPELLGAEGRELADAVVDLSDFLLQLGRQKRLPKPTAPIGKVAFHVACHLRVQNLGYKGRDLLKWAGGDVTLVDKCCGMDGTWGMKKEYFPTSLQIAEAAAGKVVAAEPDVVAADCPLAGIQLRQKTGRTSYHPVKILRAAYDGTPLRSPTSKKS